MNYVQNKSKPLNWLSHWRLSLFLPGYILLGYAVAFALAHWDPVSGLFQLIGAAIILPLLLLCAPWLPILEPLGLVEGSIFPMPTPLGLVIVAAFYGVIGHLLLRFLPARWRRPRHPVLIWIGFAVLVTVAGGFGAQWLIYEA